MRHGATYLGGGACAFTVWAPLRERVDLRLAGPDERLLPMARDDDGYWHVRADGVEPGTRYLYRLDGTTERPDPASRNQPEGVHGPSAVVDTQGFHWTDSGWKGRKPDDLFFYEIHVGTFTPEGTFDGIVSRLPYLADLGITAIELMPVAHFPGSRNWGYDGVYPFAPHEAYGGPAGLAALVDACHAAGIAVFLDVVYNHLGPEGNYLPEFGPYLTSRYQTPWGDAINYDGPYSDGVRDFFIESALSWVRDFHVDGLRLDAVHAIYDFSTRPFLAELADNVHRVGTDEGRTVYLIAEDDRNDSRIVRSHDAGGYGVDGLWSDDFHHALHTLVTGERDGYYEDFGSLALMAKVLREGFAYTGEYSRFRKRRQGIPTNGIPPRAFVVCAQNHDQIGNRFKGDRLAAKLSLEQLKLVAATVILSPFLPLLFMGEEYGETAPFNYFVEHSDVDLVEGVRRGRREEFSAFEWDGPVPDPQSTEVFEESKLVASLRDSGGHAFLYGFYRHLIHVRRRLASLHPEQQSVRVREYPEQGVLLVKRRHPPEQVIILLNFSDQRRDVPVPLPLGWWERVLDSSAPEWGGDGPTTPEGFEAAGTALIAVAPWAAAAFRMEGAVHHDF